jgi:hypothetical protein
MAIHVQGSDSGSTGTYFDGLSDEQIVNDLIVLITAIILFVSILIWSFIFCIRFYRLQGASLPPTDPMADHKLLTSKNVRDNIEENERIAKEKKAKRKSKTIQTGSTTDGQSVTDGIANQSEQSYLLDSPVSKQSPQALRKIFNNGPTALAASSAKDSLSVKSMFTLVMSDGMTLTMHTMKGPKPINMVLSGRDILWKTARLFSRKRSKMNVSEILSVVSGKTTDVFRLPAAGSIPDDCCFSIISNDFTLDLQVTSKVERDAVVQGFLALMKEAKQEEMAAKSWGK